MLDYIANRLKEKSTYTALGILFTAVGFNVAPGLWESVAMIGMGIGGALGVLLPARVNKSNVDATK